MTVVTSSRKPAPRLRTLGKDLAFALGARYTPRGKAGMPEVLDRDPDVIIIAQKGAIYVIQVFHDGFLACELPFISFVVEQRTGNLKKGLRTGNQTVYEAMGRYVDIISDHDQATLTFDGAQRRRYILTLQQ